MPARRFPPPWTAEELEACFVPKDNAGQLIVRPINQDFIDLFAEQGSVSVS
jgi:hypothetical protein